MQSGGYGGVSHEIHQQFMVDGSCPPSLFSTPAHPNPNSPASADIHAVQRYHHPLSHHHHHHHQQPQPQPQPPHFAHFGAPIPITQQLFQHAANQHHHPQFQFFHQYQQQQQQHLGLEQEASGPESADGPTGPTSFLAAMNFKLGVNESSGGGGGSRDALDDDDGSESRLHLHHQHHHPWHRDNEDQSAAAAAANIKEPFWRPLDIDYINPNNKRPASSSAKDKQQPAEISSKHLKKSNNNEILEHNHNQASGNAATTTNSSNQTGDSNYKLFSELEAIYKPNEHVQTGSGSALTGDDNSTLMPAAAAAAAASDHPAGPTLDNIQPDNISNSTSNFGAEVTPPVLATDDKYDKAGASSSGGGRRKSKKRRQQKQLAAIATFFESLVKQLMDHQESLHRRFVEVMEKRDQERSSREEAWRKQEAARASREAAGRAEERALAASREAAIISFLEKITGESLKLPEKPQLFAEDAAAIEVYSGNVESYNNNNSSFGCGGGGVQMSGSSRWPKAEVQALIRVRSGFETRFQEPGLKSPLWEEVSQAMAKLGYSRSAKRCKEKWENINKYFRKTKDSGKKRPQHSKTCPYFHQLDQLYSRSSHAAPNTNTNERKEMMPANNSNSELLDAIVVANKDDQAAGIRNNTDHDDINHEYNVDDPEDDQEDGDDEEEGQGESQDQAQDHQCENYLDS